MKKGKYVGPDQSLKNERAILLVNQEAGIVLAQFNRLRLGREFTHTWTEYPIEYFEIEEGYKTT